MTRVLLVCEYPSLHGGERSMLATLAGLRRAGFSIAVMGPPEGPLAEAVRSQDLEVVPFEFRDTAGRRLPQDRLRSRLARQIERRSPELLHANSLAMGRLCGPVAADLKLPSIAHLRDIVRLSRRAVADLNRNTRLLAVSRATREFHVAAGVSAAKTHVVYNGVDLARFRPRPPTGYLHRELGLPPGTPLVGTIGQICLRKGQDALLKAAVLLTGELPEVHYVIVGRRWSEKAESRRFEAGGEWYSGLGDRRRRDARDLSTAVGRRPARSARRPPFPCGSDSGVAQRRPGSPPSGHGSPTPGGRGIHCKPCGSRPGSALRPNTQCECGNNLYKSPSGWHALSAAKGVFRRVTTPFVPQGVPPGPLALCCLAADGTSA